MKSAISALTASLVVSSTLAAKGFDYSTLQTKDTHECWKSNGITFVVPRAFHSNGVIDTNGKTNVANARAAGIPYVDIYMFPCRGKNP